MKGEFFILGVFLFIFGMIILEIIYRIYKRTKGMPVPHTYTSEFELYELKKGGRSPLDPLNPTNHGLSPGDLGYKE